MRRVIQTEAVNLRNAPVEALPGQGTAGIWARLGAICMLGALLLAACNENPLDSGFPEVEIILDSLEYGRAPVTNEARVTFLIANRGPGTAYFEGCPDPIGMVIEQFMDVDSSWLEVKRPNSCLTGEVPEQTSLDANQAYGYTLIWDEPGLYRVRVFYGDEIAVTTGHFAESQEYAVR